MPYIEYAERPKFDYHITRLASMIGSWGDVNYIVSKLIKELYTAGGLSYNFINNAMGVLTCIQAEFYRTVAEPYENKKREENGDI